MNQNHPSPEDDDVAAREARTEQRLKRLQPRSVNFNAETIMRAADDTRRHSTLTERSMRKRRAARWLPIAASWAGGAVAGALLTFLVLTLGSAETVGLTPHARQAVPDPESSTVAVDKSFDRVPSGPRDPHNSADRKPSPERLGVESPQWSRNERLISSQLLDLHRPRSTGDPPLMAASYVWLTSKSAAPVVVEDLAHGENQPRTNSSDSDGNSANRELRPPLSANPELLLRELLGVPPNSRL